MASLRVEALTTIQDLQAIRQAWTELWERCPDATPFQSPEWLLPWWQHLGRGRLHTVAVREGSRLVGLAPFFVSRYFGLPVRRLCLLGTGNTDYLDVLLEPNIAAEAMAAVLQHLADHPIGAAFADFQQLREGSALRSCPLPACYEQRSFIQEVCPQLELPSTPDELPNVLPKRLRANLRYYRRRLEREGGTFETADAETLGASLDALFELHQRLWRRRHLPGVFASTRVRRFHEEAAAGFLRQGWLRLHLLRHQGEVAAALYCFTTRRRGYYYAGGFDPAFARLSPGTVLTGQAIEDAAGEGASVFDFLRGDEPYKYAWSAIDRPNYRRLCWRAGTPGQIAPALVAWEQRAERAVKQLARRMQSAPGRG